MANVVQMTATAFADEQIDLIKKTICKGATDDELRLFLYQCKRTGLDPLARQIYSVERNEKRNGQWIKTRSIQTSIDGLRLVAERTGKYAGQLGPMWCGIDGQWMDVWLSTKPPHAAKVGVLRNDFKEPCWGVARYDAFVQTREERGERVPTRMWAAMPDVMLAKCAESQALRRAFPQELSGLYADDEMMQAATLHETDLARPVCEASRLMPPAPEPPIDPVAGEVLEPHTMPAPTDHRGWIAWGRDFIAAIKTAKTEADLAEWQRLNEIEIKAMSIHAPRGHKSVTGAIAAQAAVIAKSADQALITDADVADILRTVNYSE